MVAILVFIAILLMITIDILIIRRKRAEAGDTNTSPEVFNKNSMFAPAGYFFSKGHIWAKSGKQNEIITGVDDFILKSLGKVYILKFADELSHLNKGDIFMEGKFDSKTISFRSPVNGTVKKVNNSLLGKFISDPYNNDWGIIIEPDNNELFATGMLKAGEAVDWMKNEFKKLKEFLVYNQDKPKLAGVTMYDGGNVMTGAISHLDEVSLRDFEELFLSV